MAVRGSANQTLAAGTAAMSAMHICLGPGFIDEDQALGIKTILIGLPACACRGDVRSVLFLGQHGFF